MTILWIAKLLQSNICVHII